MTDRRQAAVDHLSSMLERDLLAIDDYRALVDRVLATTDDAELGAILSTLPATPPQPPLVLSCDGGVVREVPLRLPQTTEIVCRSGVMKVDLSLAAIDEPIVDVEVECDAGVLRVLLPRDVVVEVAEHTSTGGVFRNRARGVRAAPGVPRIVVHVRNGGGVIRLRHRWRRRRR